MAKQNLDGPRAPNSETRKIMRGLGGETHQLAGGDVPVLTTQQGTPVSDDQNSLRVGRRGPTLLEDHHFREKIFHFDHERTNCKGKELLHSTAPPPEF